MQFNVDSSNEEVIVEENTPQPDSASYDAISELDNYLLDGNMAGTISQHMALGSRMETLDFNKVRSNTLTDKTLNLTEIVK